jgi:hypothetical protein
MTTSARGGPRRPASSSSDVAAAGRAPRGGRPAGRRAPRVEAAEITPSPRSAGFTASSRRFSIVARLVVIRKRLRRRPGASPTASTSIPKREDRRDLARDAVETVSDGLSVVESASASFRARVDGVGPRGPTRIEVDRPLPFLSRPRAAARARGEGLNSAGKIGSPGKRPCSWPGPAFLEPYERLLRRAGCRRDPLLRACRRACRPSRRRTTHRVTGSYPGRERRRPRGRRAPSRGRLR